MIWLVVEQTTFAKLSVTVRVLALDAQQGVRVGGLTYGLGRVPLCSNHSRLCDVRSIVGEGELLGGVLTSVGLERHRRWCAVLAVDLGHQSV